MASISGKQGEKSLVSLVSIPDALEPEDDRKDRVKFLECLSRVMPGQLKKLIENIKQANADEQITCVIADMAVGWILEVPKEMGIEGVSFFTGGPASLALSLGIPKLIEAGILGDDGKNIATSVSSCKYLLGKGESIILSNEIPTWKWSKIPWSIDDPVKRKAVFEHLWTGPPIVQNTNLILSNSCHEQDPSVSKLVPNIFPIGPLLASHHMGTFAGNFWPQDSTCLSWLDKQNAGSVIYVAFGSIAIFSPQQLDELALGLELTGHPLLWMDQQFNFPDGFINRVSDHGKFVEWAPQEKVLAHPSIACFVNHCGWNPTMEGLSMGLPFQCLPYFADQLRNRIYICDIWKIVLSLAQDENEIITRHEISRKIKTLIPADGK
ncbi:hypothetical protein CRYUN_Cryun12cG0157000 [Craigia yunnanensis]